MIKFTNILYTNQPAEVSTSSASFLSAETEAVASSRVSTIEISTSLVQQAESAVGPAAFSVASNGIEQTVTAPKPAEFTLSGNIIEQTLTVPAETKTAAVASPDALEAPAPSIPMTPEATLQQRDWQSAQAAVEEALSNVIPGEASDETPAFL